MALALFAGIRVREFAAARAWYERLLGDPSFFPHATEAVWILADDRSVYIEEDADRAGGALITVFVDDLDAVVAEIASRGLEPPRARPTRTVSARRPTAMTTATRSDSAARRRRPSVDVWTEKAGERCVQRWTR